MHLEQNHQKSLKTQSQMHSPYKSSTGLFVRTSSIVDTREWAASHSVCIDDIAPPIEDYTKAYPRSAAKIAIQTIILHCITAVGYQVDPLPIINWLKDQGIWEYVSPNEKVFLCANNRSDKECSDARWRQEAQWALLWTIGKIESLDLPTQYCDSARLVDEIMPRLGDPIEAFVSSAELRSPSELMAEDDRIYNLHYDHHSKPRSLDHRRHRPLPR